MFKRLIVFNFILFLISLNTVHSIEPDIFVQSTVNRASDTLSGNKTKEELQDQATDLRKAIQSAAKSESWQAYAALNRQLLQTIGQIQQVAAQTGQIDKMDALTDEQLLNEITNVIYSLPPLARQRIQQELGMLTNNVIPISK